MLMSVLNEKKKKRRGDSDSLTLEMSACRAEISRERYLTITLTDAPVENNQPYTVIVKTTSALR